MVTIIYLKNHGLGGPFFGFFGQLPYHDKIGHFALMGILGLLSVRAIAPRLKRPAGPAAIRVLLILVGLIAIEELSQGLLSRRTLSLSDFLFGVVGALFGGWMAHRMNLRARTDTASQARK